MELFNVSATLPQERNLEVQRYTHSAILDVTDYALDALFHAAFLRFDEADGVLILASDHIVSDGASLAILRGEILEVYAQLTAGYRPYLHPVGMHCIDYAIWQRNRLFDPLRAQSANWAPFGRTRFPEEKSAIDQEGWGTERFALDRCTTLALRHCARLRGTSLPILALTAYVALVIRWCEVSDSIIQVMSDGRTNRLVDRTVAYLAFPLYVRIAVSGQETVLDLLEIVKEEYCRSCERPDFFYSYAQDHAGAFTRNTCFNWLPIRNEFEGKPRTSSGQRIDCTRIDFRNPFLSSLKWDAEPSIVYEESIDGIIGEVAFSQRRFSHRIMNRFVQNLRLFLSALLETPTARIVDIQLK